MSIAVSLRLTPGASSHVLRQEPGGAWGTLGWRPPFSTKFSAGWPRDTGAGLSAIRATAAGNGLEDFGLFTGTGVLDKMPDVDDTIGAGVVGAIEVRDRPVYVRNFDVLRRSAG